ncbi:MAG: hypothetical protein JW746_08905 [Candidatus Krumholzibacteriota bacterium]|nr:hypothetical protein [Candidatus Krumholzibacteriota bacterium]
MRRIEHSYTAIILLTIFILSPYRILMAAGLPDGETDQSRVLSNSGHPVTEDVEMEADRPNSVFDKKNDGDFNLKSYRMNETLRLSGEKLDSPSVSISDMSKLRKGSAPSSNRYRGKKKIALSVLASALLPGLGELYLYADQGDRSDWSTLARVPSFMGMDAFLWYKYKINHDEGIDTKKEYEAFCDEHWSEERFLLQHPYCENVGGCDDWQEYNENAGDDWPQYYFLYIPKSLDREEYYENCGKYDAFVFGWDDWDPEGWDYSYETFEPWTPNRTIYWDLREESDKFVVRADQYLMMLMLNRVVSMIDVLWLAHQMNNDTVDDGGWSLDIMPDAVNPAVGISYRF